ncbi:hypothetical protein OTU49_006654 [Cherax quadricarinatus]|uniref:Orange domain-containing protein n=1 Tax=Cherax quadricarinatus TaxID=27406 RepID=A0AAW0YB76_CHEQU|nr:uncharacterized protein LOC128684508 [Cherax quadricarinatus]
MPVPVSPRKNESSQAANASRPEARAHPAEDPVQVPVNLPRLSEEVEEIVDPDVVAGYQDCLKETLRFLLEEEHLPEDHPVVTGLAAHLTREHAHIELTKLSQQLATAIIDAQTTPTDESEEEISTNNSNTLRVPRTFNAGFEVTLVEDDSEEEIIVLDDDAMDEDDCEYINIEELSDSEDNSEYEAGDLEEERVTEALITDPELRRQLIRFVYQGCDLFAAPPPINPASHQGVILQL